jgi:hypothetical protein
MPAALRAAFALPLARSWARCAGVRRDMRVGLVSAITLWREARRPTSAAPPRTVMEARRSAVAEKSVEQRPEEGGDAQPEAEAVEPRLRISLD